jgi:protein TonB
MDPSAVRRMNLLFDWRSPWPLLTVLFLHIGFFYALQAGLLRRFAETPVMKEIIATLITPEPPKPPPKIEPLKPLPAIRPVTVAVAPQPAILPPANTIPSETAIMLPAVIQPPPPPVPFVPAPPVVAPPAPVVAEPAPLIPPRFDAAYLNNPAPAYPSLARRMGDQGKVMLRVNVNTEGRAQDVQVRTSSGFPRLDETALNTVKQWRFVPARQGDQPVSAWVLVPIVFRLEG